jgi:hypothetical protein
MYRARLVLAAFSLSIVTAPAQAAISKYFNQPGNVLVSDQFNNRVIEITPAGDIVWEFGLGPNDVSSASTIAVNDAQRVGRRTLISATGAPPGSEPLCPAGCNDSRVLLVNASGQVVWQYGQFGVTGAGPNQLNTPVQSTWTANHTVLITDQGNQRIIEVNLKNQILWQYGTTGVAGAGPNQLNNPNSAEVLNNGDVLIADENNNRAIDVNRAGQIQATFSAHGTVSGVAFASRLPNGDTLITDSNNSRIVEVDANDNVVWSVVTNTQPRSNPTPLPSRAIRLASGNTIISDQFNHRVFVVNKGGRILVQYGTINMPGYNATSAIKLLNAPYDAKVIGDSTGLTFSDSLNIIPKR